MLHLDSYLFDTYYWINEYENIQRYLKHDVVSIYNAYCVIGAKLTNIVL